MKNYKKMFRKQSNGNRLLNAAEIGVIVKDGIVTLTGTVDSYCQERGSRKRS